MAAPARVVYATAHGRAEAARCAVEDAGLSGLLAVEVDGDVVELVGAGRVLTPLELARLDAALLAYDAVEDDAADPAESPRCRECGDPTAPDRVDVSHADETVTCAGCSETPVEAYLLDAILERLGDGEVGIGPDPESDSDDWDYVDLDSAYDTADDAGGHLVLTVPAAGSRPSRRFRVVLEEIHDIPAGDLGRCTEADWAGYERGFTERRAAEKLDTPGGGA